MAMSIGGLLTNWPDSELAKIFNKPGQRHRGSTYRKELQRRYEAGERYLPMNYPECEGWSYVMVS